MIKEGKRGKQLSDTRVWGTEGGGGGLLSLEKGTNCGLTVSEL